MTLHSQFRPQLESLGDRAMPSMVLSGGVLSIGGTAGADAIRVWSPAAGELNVSINSTGENQTFSLSEITRLEIRAGRGNDFVSIRSELSVDSMVRGSAGHDVINGGSGDDNLHGNSGNDVVRGRGGNDDVIGDDGHDRCDGGDGDDRCNGGGGNDDVRGGSGDDSLDGGSGRDTCHGGNGDDDIRNGFDLDTELLAVFTGGQGSAEFKFGPDDGGIEREFEVEVEDLPPNGLANVVVDGVAVGTIRLNAFGDGRLEYEVDFDRNNDGNVDFPPGFPEIHAGSSVSVLMNGIVVRAGTFVEAPNN